MIFISLTGCSNQVRKAPSAFLTRNQQDPALSGNGQNLALIVDQRGRQTTQLQNIKDGRILPLRHLSQHQPHSSPSLSWNARYVAVIIQRGNKRIAVIEDRLTGQIHPLTLPKGDSPIRLSLSPDARLLAMQVASEGNWRVEVFDLSEEIEPDEIGGIQRTNSLNAIK